MVSNQRTISAVLLVFVFLAGGSSTAHAWSRFGHEVVGHLAEQELSPPARAAVAALLDGETLASVGAWADEVRPQRPDTAPLHYLNGPIDRLIPGASDFASPRGNVYSAVLGYSARLVEPSVPQHERVEALKFLVHFVADLHQPLHVGFREDRGANDFAVVYRDRLINLHRYWDNEIFDEPREQLGSHAYAAWLLAHFSDDDRTRWVTLAAPRDWVIEARRLLFNGLYPRPRSDAGQAAHPQIAVIDESYIEVWRPVAERQLARAGARLAWTLNQLFETGQSPFEAAPVPVPPTP